MKGFSVVLWQNEGFLDDYEQLSTYKMKQETSMKNPWLPYEVRNILREKYCEFFTRKTIRQWVRTDYILATIAK